MIFGWQRTRLRHAAMPVIITDPLIGGEKEYIALRALLPSEYDDDLDTLAARYPCPQIKED